MTKTILLIGIFIIMGACNHRSVYLPGHIGADGTDGRDGVGCTSSDYYEEDIKIGIMITCSDNSVSYILNGINGEQGDTGPQGIQGEHGEQGEPGIGCTVYRPLRAKYIIIQCGEDIIKLSDRGGK